MIALRLAVLMLIGAMLLGACAAPRDRSDGKQAAGTDQADQADQAAETNPADSVGPAESARLGPTSGDEEIQFTVGLNVDDAAVAAFLGRLTDPRSADYQRFLSAAEFGERFGLGPDQVASVVDWARAGGLTAESVPQRTSVAVSGPVAAVNRLLGVTLVDWRTADGIRFHRPDGRPLVPGELSNQVAQIIGLDTEPLISPSLGRILASGVPAGGLVPATVSRAYEIEPLHSAGIQGQGQVIAILSLDALTPSDVDRFDERYGITGPPVEVIRIPGALTEPGAETAEVALDVQIVRGIAPQARILDYEGPKTSAGIAALIARIVADGLADIVSVSWGGCEKLIGSAATTAAERELTAAVAAGISVFIASGDNGAYSCRRAHVSEDPFERDTSQSTLWPASSPSVISVGGTFLSTREDGTYISEAGWEEPLSMGGGGGGLSAFFDRPSWQQGAGVDNAASNGMRQLPDVSGPGDPASGFFIEYTEPGSGLTAAQIGGTSAAAPMWAASMVLARQLAQTRGVVGLGMLGPVLYQIAAEQPQGAVFHDVVRGGNLLHQAGAGWDYSTGLGSPRVAPLANAIADFLTR